MFVQKSHAGVVQTALLVQPSLPAVECVFFLLVNSFGHYQQQAVPERLHQGFIHAVV